MSSSIVFFVLLFLFIVVFPFSILYFSSKEPSSRNSSQRVFVAHGEAADIKKAFLGIVRAEIKSMESPRLPYCDDTIMDVVMEDSRHEDFSTWSWNDDLCKIALSAIFNTCYDLLETQRFTLTPGYFNPLGQQLWHVMNNSLSKACSKQYITCSELEETKEAFRKNVLEF